MSNIDWISIIISIASSLLIFAITQLLIGKNLKLIDKFSQIKADVSYTLILYANLYDNPIDPMDEGSRVDDYKNASQEIRKISARLRGFIEEINHKKRTGLPPIEKIFEASRELIGLSNSMWLPANYYKTNSQFAYDHSDRNSKRVETIKTLLSIYNKN